MATKKRRPVKRAPTVTEFKELTARVSDLSRLIIALDKELKALTSRVAELEHDKYVAQVALAEKNKQVYQGGSRTFF